MGASLALAGLNGCVFWPEQKLATESKRPDGRTPGVPVNYATCFELGGVAEGLLVKSYDGRPIKVEGNPLHPINRGATSAYAQALLLEMYDPNRSQRIVRRAPGGQQLTATWDDFAAALKPLREKKGKGLHILSEASSSITLADMRKRLEAALPESKWYEYEPIERASHDWLRNLPIADVIVCFDCDILGNHPGALKYTRDFVSRRNPDGKMNRLYVVECGLTITGAMADHRLAVKPSELKALYAKFLASIESSDEVTGLPPVLAQASADCRAHIGSWEVFAAQNTSSVNDIAALAGAIDRGEVETLLIFGGNPAYSGPMDLDFEQKLKQVPTSAHLSLYEDETSAACTWHLPRAHVLESWGDACSSGGTLCMQQPLIEPLYSGKTPIEVLALVLGEQPLKGYDLVRRAFKETLKPNDFEGAWRKALHNGVTPPAPARSNGEQHEPFEIVALEQVNASPGLDLLFVPDYRLYDGRFAQNGWLQELPDPITKLTWDNAAIISPETAREQNVGYGDMVKLEVNGRSLEIAIFTLPGVAKDTVILPLGYGRSFGGEKVGFNTYALRTSKAMHYATGAKMTRLGGRYKFATTQDHKITSEVATAAAAERAPTLARSGDLRTYQNNPKFAQEPNPPAPFPTREGGAVLPSPHRGGAGGGVPGEHASTALFSPPVEYKGHRWGMVIDLARCTGCSACVLACQAENNIPVVGKEEVAKGRQMQWIRIDRYIEPNPPAPFPTREGGAVLPSPSGGGVGGGVTVRVQPVACVHCENAPCEQVCPVGATVHSSEGLNDMVYNRCVGTRYCSNNCPYKVRRFNWFNNHLDTTPVEKLMYNPDVTVRSRGVMEKCTYCVQRIEAARAAAKQANQPLKDGAIVPACAQVCPAQAIVFGDMNDPNSAVAKQAASPRAYGLLEQLNTKPRTQYLAKVWNPSTTEEKEGAAGK
ncbi:MAG TPA: 4Fe-4S dicluster domain-containing protein [Planctomycetota bacterium]|jgi:molybdopterin-containing oxidoreductase family iron-sulfur binding subunit